MHAIIIALSTFLSTAAHSAEPIQLWGHFDFYECQPFGNCYHVADYDENADIELMESGEGGDGISGEYGFHQFSTTWNGRTIWASVDLDIPYSQDSIDVESSVSIEGKDEKFVYQDFGKVRLPRVEDLNWYTGGVYSGNGTMQVRFSVGHGHRSGSFSSRGN